MSKTSEDFATWYYGLWPQVLRAVTVTVGDRDLAEEATAEAFAKALARWPRPAEVDSPLAWMHRVAVNEVRSRWRRARLERRVLERIAAEPRPPTAAPELHDDALWAAVSALPERARHIVALHLEVNEIRGADTHPGTTLWAQTGDMYLADGIDGNPAVVLMNDPEQPMVIWEPVPGEVAATLSGSGYDSDKLLEIARSIKPVPADDERLIDVWGSCPTDELSSRLITPCED